MDIDTRPTVFIGSSSEGIKVAEALKQAFGDSARVEVWNSGAVFAPNKSFLASLLNASSLFDFAVLVFSSDDKLTSRDEEREAARDNVIFEFGLFLGRQGPHRAIALIQDKLKPPSDLAGIHLDKFKLNDDGTPDAAFPATAKKIVDSILQHHYHTAEFHQLPSTALAIGYFNNFLVKVLDELDDFKPVKIGEETVNYSDFSLTVLIPDELSLVTNKNLKGALRGLTQMKVTSSVFRDFPFYLQAAPGAATDKLELFDIPTTMSSSKEAVERIFKEEFVGKSNLQKRAEAREVANFQRTLELLLDERLLWKRRIKFRNLSEFVGLD